MKNSVLHCAFFASLGLVFSPLAVAHASSSPADRVHFCAPFDYEQWRRDHPRPAGKRLAALNKGEERTVRMIYFLPNDRPYRAEVVQKMKDEMLHIQTVYAEQMQAQGQGNRTFRIETDAQGQPRVHRVNGRYPNSHYLQHDTAGDVLEEIDPIFDIEANVYLIVVDSKDPILSNGHAVGGVGNRSGKMGGFAFADGNVWFDVAAHELGHAFGLQHDFHDDTYIMSYGGSDRTRISDCNAEFLAVHPYLNPNVSTEREWDQYIKTVEPTDDYSVGSTSVSIRLEVGSPKGLHQALLFSTTKEPHFAAGFLEVQACRGLAGQEETLVGFEYDGKIPSSPSSRFSGSPVHVVNTLIVDKEGNDFSKNLVFAQKSPHRVAYLRQEHWVQSVSFSPDGTLLALGGGTQISVWKWRTDKASTPVRGQNGPMLFSPNGRLLAVGGWNEVQLLDVTGTQLVATFEYDAQTEYSESMSFSPDGDLLAIGTSKNVELWDVAAKRRVAAINVDDHWVSGVSFSRDGSLLAFENGKEVVLWDVASKRRVDALKHQEGWFRAVSFSPDGTLLGVSRGENVDLWDVARRRQITSFEHQGWVGAVSFSPDGNLVAAAGFAGASVWDVSSRRRAAIFYGEGGNSMSFSPDGTLLAVGSADATVRLWDVSDFKPATPHALTKVSGEGQEGFPGSALAEPFVVKVLDQNGSAVAGAVVTFSVTAGGGTLSPTTATTDTNGRARSTLTLGPDLGTNTVTATVEGLEPVTFTAIGQATTDSDGEPQAWLTPDPAEVEFYADDPAWKTFTVHTNLDSVLIHANPSGSDLAIEVEGGPRPPTRAYCPAEGNDRPRRGRRDGWNLYVKACQAGQTKILLKDYDTGAVVRQYEIRVEASTSAAATTALNPSYPNPFNSETVLSYTLPTASDIRLEIFTLNGQRVAVLHEGFQAAGYHTISMDASALASGVYLYRLTTPEGRFTQKFTLLR